MGKKRVQMKKEEPMIVYWAPKSDYANKNLGEWNMLHAKPQSLFNHLLEEKHPEAGNRSIFSCPPWATKAKRTFIFRQPYDSHYRYDFTGDNTSVESLTPIRTNLEPFRQTQSFKDKIQLTLFHETMFFAEEPLIATMMSPYFHEPKYTKYGAIANGEYDIGQWYRPVSPDITFWKPKGEFLLEENEPLFYMEFQTDRPVILKRYKFNGQLNAYSDACVNAPFNLESRVPLAKRYARFRNANMRELILKEIKENLI